MNATANEFQPFETTNTTELGTVVQVHAKHCTLPESLLPFRLRLDSTCVGRDRSRSWFAQTPHGESHRVGLISLPRVHGDGTQSLEQLVYFLVRNGYVEEPCGPGDPTYYVRP